jgi:SAM-dependent methyltransferase
MQNCLDSRLLEHRKIWNAKPTLRTIYADFHRRLEGACPTGPLLEIGGGSAHFKEYRQDAVSLDLLPFVGIDVVGDAHLMAFRDQAFSAVVMLDTLHHLQRPISFLREARRVLRPGGRLAMIEPGISAASHILYSKYHHERVDMQADPFAADQVQSSSDPWDANQAIPTLMFATRAARLRLEELVCGMKILSVHWLSIFVYPLSGGFNRWCLVPQSLTSSLLSLETLLLPFLGRFLGFRIFVVLERQ